MVESLGLITLKNGEEVEASVVIGPDLDWAPRIGPLLQHKGDPWNWQVAQVLERELDLEAYFYVLHRDGIPFANIMTIEGAGVGVFGHVWTVPEDRQKGASSRLMALQMEHFADRGGRALFLGTGYDSVAYKMYQRFGFESVEPQSGYMSYYTESESDIQRRFFPSIAGRRRTANVAPLAVYATSLHGWVAGRGPAGCVRTQRTDDRGGRTAGDDPGQ